MSMRAIISAVGLTLNAVLLFFMIVAFVTEKDRRKIKVRSHVLAMIYMAINMIAILYGGHL